MALDNESRKARRRFFNELKNRKAKASSVASKSSQDSRGELVDLSKKDNRSGRGRYV